MFDNIPVPTMRLKLCLICLEMLHGSLVYHRGCDRTKVVKTYMYVTIWYPMENLDVGATLQILSAQSKDRKDVEGCIQMCVLFLS